MEDASDIVALHVLAPLASFHLAQLPALRVKLSNRLIKVLRSLIILKRIILCCAKP